MTAYATGTKARGGPAMPPLLSSRDVCRAAGVTYRQLDYWWRTGILTPARPGHGSGTAHRWSEADVTRVKVIKYLMVWPPGSARIATILSCTTSPRSWATPICGVGWSWSWRS